MKKLKVYWFFKVGGWIFIMKMQSPGVKKYQILKIFACGGLFLFHFNIVIISLFTKIACSGHLLNF